MRTNRVSSELALSKFKLNIGGAMRSNQSSQSNQSNQSNQSDTESVKGAIDAIMSKSIPAKELALPMRGAERAAMLKRQMRNRSELIDFVTLRQHDLHRVDMQSGYVEFVLGDASGVMNAHLLSKRFDVPIAQVFAVLEGIHTCSRWMRAS